MHSVDWMFVLLCGISALLAALRPVRIYIVAHGSMALALVLIVVGIYLMSLGQRAFVAPTPVLLSSIGATALTTALALVFFALPDTRTQIAAALWDGFSNRESCAKFSATTKQNMLNTLLEDLVADSARTIEPTLVARWLDLGTSYLGGPYLEQYDYFARLEPGDSDGIRSRTVLQYRVRIAHLKSPTLKFPILWALRWVAPSNGTSDTQPLEKFEVKINGKVAFDQDDATYERCLSGSSCDALCKIDFRREVELEDGALIKIECIVSQLRHDPVDIMFVRYPTKGVTARLTFDERREFDHALFRPVLTGEHAIDGEDPNTEADSISFRNDGWLFPGHGFVLAFPEKPLPPPDS